MNLYFYGFVTIYLQWNTKHLFKTIFNRIKETALLPKNKKWKEVNCLLHVYVWLWKPWLTWHSLSWWAPVEWGGLCSCPRPVSPAGQGDSDRSHTVPAPVDPLCWCTAFWNASVKFSSCLKKKNRMNIKKSISNLTFASNGKKKSILQNSWRFF